jgi:hypothetical protein
MRLSARPTRPVIRSLIVSLVGLTVFFVSGCVTAPPTYKTTADARARVAAARKIAIIRPDVEMREVSAGGVAEKRDEWSNDAAANLVQRLVHDTGYVAANPVSADLQPELAEVRTLIRTIVENHFVFLMAPDSLSSTNRPLSYHLGSLDRLADSCGADALLFVFAQNTQPTGGRKALEILGFALPTGAIASAMLVERDGTVVWFNYYFAQRINLRDAGDVEKTSRALLNGLPRA